ncbi:hypothetical protein AB0L40_15885 [Patulibacter sp. NPDC049589]|uniref:hypothetical protein n=1 Tax=Patulibacter sp. NPDC049589 TaxID=3154731 RepID=UPI00341D7A06
MSTRSRAARLVAVGLAGAAAVLGVTGCGQAGEYGPDDPRSAVSQLLNASISQANGQRACSLLTEAARTRLADGVAGSCRQALNASVSSMPGPYSSTDDAGRATTDLHIDVVSQDADHAKVTARRGDNRAFVFTVVRLDGAALTADTEANQDTVGGKIDTDWRVDTGEKQLVEVAPATESDPPPTTTTAPTPAG